MLSTFEDIEIVGTAENGYKALEVCKSNDVDIVLMDIRMKECDGVMGTRLIKEQFTKVKVIILTTFKDKDYIERMPKEKIETILLYNEQDVVNLYKIFTTWKEYIIDEKDEIEDVIEEDTNIKEDNIGLEEKVEENLDTEIEEIDKNNVISENDIDHIEENDISINNLEISKDIIIE